MKNLMLLFLVFFTVSCTSDENCTNCEVQRNFIISKMVCAEGENVVVTTDEVGIKTDSVYIGFTVQEVVDLLKSQGYECD